MSFNDDKVEFYRQAEVAAEDVIIAALEKCGKSDAEVAREMERLLGKYLISADHLASIRSGNYIAWGYNEFFWPAICDVPFCIATSDWSLLRFRVHLAKLCKKSSTGDDSLFGNVDIPTEASPSQKFTDELPARIRQTRKKLRLKQSEFADKVGISQGLLSHIEIGVRTAVASTLIAIANIVPPEEKRFWLEAAGVDFDFVVEVANSAEVRA